MLGSALAAMYVAYVITECHPSGLAYKIGLDKTRLQHLLHKLADMYPNVVPSQRTVHVLHHNEICIESDVTRSLHGQLVDCDFVVRTTHVSQTDRYVVMNVTKDKVSHACISAEWRASTNSDLVLQLAHVQVIVQGVRDDAMWDVTWYNVQVRGDDKHAVCSEADRIAQVL